MGDRYSPSVTISGRVSERRVTRVCDQFANCKVQCENGHSVGGTAQGYGRVSSVAAGGFVAPRKNT